MSQRGTGRRGGRRGNFGRTTNQSLRFVTHAQLRSRLRGHQIVVSPIPTSTVARPWNSITLVFSGTTASTPIEVYYKDSDVTSKLVEQLGLNLAGTRVWAYRVIKCRVWSEVLQSKPLSGRLSCRFYSIIGEANNDYLQIYPGNVTYAALGYEWPVEQQNVVLTASGDDHIFSVFPTLPSISYIAYLDVLWKTEDPVL